MKTSLNGVLAIIAEEAIVLSTYRDGKGVPTIGIGHTAAAGEPVPISGMQITLEEALRVFARDLARFERHVASAIKRPLKTHENDALVSFDFNTGAIQSGTVDDKLNAGDIRAAMGTLQQYEKSGGKYVKGLDLRRDREEAMFTRAEYPRVTHFKVYNRYPGTPRMVPVSNVDLGMLGEMPAVPQMPADIPAPLPPKASWLTALIGLVLSLFRRK